MTEPLAIDPRDLVQIIGVKETEIFLLRQRIQALSAELTAMKLEVGRLNGNHSLSQNLS